MKRLTCLPVALLSSPALAHPGVHLAPHGAEWMPVFMGLGVIAMAAVIVLRSHVKARARARK
jgi:CHASE1-domain containing sensor protein